MPEGRKRGIKGHLGKVLAAVLMFWCFPQALLYGFSREEKDICVLTIEGGISIGEAVSMQKRQEGQPLRFSIWGEQKAVLIQNPELNRETKAGLLNVCGDSGLVLCSSFRLNLEDTRGCLIDGELCWKLFGSEDVVGQKIRINDREYEIRGILEKSGGTVLVEADKEEIGFLDQISFEVTEKGSREEALQSLANRYGLTGQCINLLSYGKQGAGAAVILPCILGFGILMPIGRRGYREKRRPVPCLGYLCVGLGGLVLFFWITEIRLTIPKDWIPSRWSDFEFFSQLWSEKGKELETLLLGEKTGPALIYMEELLHTVKYSVLSVLFYAFWKRGLKITRETEAFGWSLLFLCLAFVSALYWGRESMVAGNRMLWFLLPGYVWGTYLQYSFLKDV